ncbi:MAG: HlyD family secretion protein [Rhodospirillales bacterium]|nr:HlyD family secretion protein [Rhodospirillales bacterium]
MNDTASNSGTAGVPKAAPAPLSSVGSRFGRRRWLAPFLLALGPIAVIVGGTYFYVASGRYVSTDNAYVRADKVSISAEITGRIAEVRIAENERVAAGHVLLQIDEEPFRIALTRVEAELRSTRADLEGLKAEYRRKREQLNLARATEAFAKREFDRQSTLAQTNIVSAARLDAARHELDIARQGIGVIEEESAEIRARLDGDADLPIDRQSRYRAIRSARDAAQLDLERTKVRAPFAGVVSKKPEPGQYVTVGTPIMSLISDQNMWIEANFKETDMTFVEPGQAVTVSIDTYPDKVWHGAVESISPGTGAEFAILPPQNATGNWVKIVQRIPVRIRVESDADSLPLRAGMSTVVEIDTGRTRPLPGFARTALGLFGASDPAHAETQRSH